MATKPRRLKTPIQLWVYDNRKRLKLESADLAALTGVTVDTARGWESRGRPSEDAIAALETKFGLPAPPDAAPVGEQAALVRAISDLVEELRQTRREQAEWNKGVQDVVKALADRARLLPTDDREREPLEGARR